MRVVCGALVILALSGVLSATAFYKLCAGFRFWDDMGYVMLTQKTLVAGHPLYDETFTQYGPAYYAWKEALNAVTRLPLSHDSTALFSAGSWVAVSLLCGGYVARMSRSIFLSALTCAAVFYVLEVLSFEPGHPQEFCAVLLGGMLFASSFLTNLRRPGATLCVIGLLLGLLAMTKPNLGVYASLAACVSLSSLLSAPTSRKVVFATSALAALLLPVLLMRNNLAEAGDYCLLESGAVVLLVSRLALSRPERELSWPSFVALWGGCLAAVLGSAGYALAKGTSVAGLIHGLVLQHVGYDQVYSRWPEFGTDDVVLSLGLALLMWMTIGPARGLGRNAPWVPTVLQLSVIPVLVLVALMADPWAGPRFAWIKPVFTWSLPLVASSGSLLVHSPTAACDAAPRQLALSLAVLSALWGYPVWGSQAELSFFLLIPVAIVGFADALHRLEWPQGRAGAEGLASFRVHNVAKVLSWAAALGIVGLGLFAAVGASKAYYRLEPSGLRGAGLLRLPRAQSDFYRHVVEAARAHGRSFFTMPGLGSLYFWAGQEPPTCCMPGNWMTLLKEETQSRVVEDLRETPDLCIIRWNPGVNFWAHGRDISGNRIVRYIEDNYSTVESFEDCDFMVRRPAPDRPSGGP